jgi:hypothetical protein
MNIVPSSISDTTLVLQEISCNNVKTIIDKIFLDSEARWPAGGSPFQQWYRQNASVSTTVRDDHDRRLIAWKTGAEFSPENIFFRTIDTSRLLPSGLANFRAQIWADPSLWERIDKKDGNRVKWYTHTMAFMVCSV